MRKQIAAANWKMNLTLQQGDQLLNDIIAKPHHLASHQLAIFAVPFPYLSMAVQNLSVQTMFLLQHRIVLIKKVAHLQVKLLLKYCSQLEFSMWYWDIPKEENIITKAINY